MLHGINLAGLEQEFSNCFGKGRCDYLIALIWNLWSRSFVSAMQLINLHDLPLQSFDVPEINLPTAQSWKELSKGMRSVPKKDCKELVLKYISSIFHSICWCAYEKDQIHILITPKPRKKAESRWNAPQASQVCQGHSRPHSVHHPLSAWSWITAWFAWDALPNMQQRSLTWDQRLFTQFSWQRMATQKKYQDIPGIQDPH